MTKVRVRVNVSDMRVRVSVFILSHSIVKFMMSQPSGEYYISWALAVQTKSISALLE